MSILDGLTDATKHPHLGKATSVFKETDPLAGMNLSSEEIEHHRKYDAGKKVVEFEANPHENVLTQQKDLAAKKAVELPKDEAALKAHNESIAALEKKIGTDSQFAHAALDGHAADITKSRDHLTAIEKQFASHTANATKLEAAQKELNALIPASTGHSGFAVNPAKAETLDSLKTALEKHGEAKTAIGKLSKTPAIKDIEAIEGLLEDHGFVPNASVSEVKPRLAALEGHIKKVTPHLENTLKAGESAVVLHTAGVKDLSKGGIEAATKQFSTELAEKRGFLDNAEKAIASARTELAGATGVKQIAAAAEAGGAKMFSYTQIKNNFGKTGFKGKSQALLGSAVAIGFGVSGAKDVLTGLGVLDAGQNPDGSEKEAGGIFSGAAKLAVAAGGLWAAGKGGHVRA